MRFPKRIKHRGKVLATIYAKSKAYPFYRVCAYVAGKRRMSSYPTYAEAKSAADTLARDLAKGSQAAALSASQARDALAALERLESFRQATGQKLSLLAAVSQLCESAAKLDARTVAEAIDGFLTSVVTVKRVTVQEAIEQFIAFRKGKTVAAEGRRPKLSFDHWRNTGYWLREFADSFPGNCVADLTKEHVNLYMGSFNKAAPKTRDERRGVVKMFLAWCVEQDYLAPTHRLCEASEFKRESADPGEIECYRAAELRAMLDRASRNPKAPRKGKEPEADYRPLLPFLALAGLAGIREKEIMRLTWEDVFRVPGHVEVSALKSKTRSRRLIQMCSALVRWLEPYRGFTGPVWTKGYHRFHEDFGALRAELKIPHRRNGLRHSFVSAHFASYSDEGLTAAQAGNTPVMVHKNYKGLMTKQDGEAWFAVAPAGAANIITLPATAGGAA